MAKFQKGQSGNPGGRPQGSKDKLSGAFLSDLVESWEKHGRDVLDEVRRADPVAYVNVVARVLPKDVVLDSTDAFVEVLRAINASRTAQTIFDDEEGREAPARH